MRHPIRALAIVLAAAVGLMVGVAPAGAVVIVADGLIKLEGDDAFRGDNIYNLTGQGQSRTTSAQQGEVVAFRVRAQNDGSAIDGVGIDSTGGGGGFRVRYFDHGVDVTDQVVNTSGGQIESLDPGEFFTLTLEVKVRASATPGAKLVVHLQAEVDPGDDDSLRARVKVV